MSKLVEQSTANQTATAGKKRGRKPPIPNKFFNGTRPVRVPLHPTNEHTVTMGALQEPIKIPSLRNKPISKVSDGKLGSSDTGDFVWVERRRTPAPLVSCPSSECSWEDKHSFSGNTSYCKCPFSDFDPKGSRLNGKAPLSSVHDFGSVSPKSSYPEKGNINFNPLSREFSKQNIGDTGISSLGAWKVPEWSTQQKHLADDNHPCSSNSEGGEKSLAACQFASDSCIQLPALEPTPLGYELALQSKNSRGVKQQRKNKLTVIGGRIYRVPEIKSVTNDNIAIPPEATWPKTPSANPNPRSHASNTVITLLTTGAENCMSQTSLSCDKGLITPTLLKSVGNTNNEEQTWSSKNEEHILKRKLAPGVQNSMPKFLTQQNFNFRQTQRINVQQNNCRCGMVQTGNPIAMPIVQGSPLMFYAATTPSLPPYGFVSQQALVSTTPYQLGRICPYDQQQQYFYPSESLRQPQFYGQEFPLRHSNGFQKLYKPLTSENLAIHNRASIEYYNSTQDVMIGF